MNDLECKNIGPTGVRCCRKGLHDTHIWYGEPEKGVDEKGFPYCNIAVHEWADDGRTYETYGDFMDGWSEEVVERLLDEGSNAAPPYCTVFEIRGTVDRTKLAWYAEPPPWMKCDGNYYRYRLCDAQLDRLGGFYRVARQPLPWVF